MSWMVLLTYDAALDRDVKDFRFYMN